MHDVTFLIPVRIDSAERRENLDTVVLYLRRNLNASIMIGEHGAADSLRGAYDCDYFHLHSESESFHISRLLNLMADRASTPFAVIYNADVLLPVEAYREARALLLRDEADFVYPYNGHFFDISRSCIPEIIGSGWQLAVDPAKCTLLMPDSVGGALFFQMAPFQACGMMNENFVSYGPEDQEFYCRAVKLGYRIARTPNALLHLNHPRGPNSLRNNPYEAHNYQEFLRVSRMQPSALKEYVRSWRRKPPQPSPASLQGKGP